MAKKDITPSDDKNQDADDKEFENLDPATATDPELAEYHARIRGDFKYDLIAHDNYVKDFDAYEAMLINKPYDSVTRKVGGGLSDGRTTTIYQERAARVVGQLPDGVMKAAGKKDAGASAVLDIIRQKYLYPNANAQAPFLEKIRNWQFYSSVYGFMPMYYDWNVTETGYIGPDCWLWHPRNFIPQLGRASIDDMDYVTALIYVGASYLEELLDEPDDAEWDKEEIENLILATKESRKDVNSQRDSLITRERQSQADKGRIMLATRYESGDDGNWVVFAPEFNGIILRTIRNPHKNGRIPFVIKHATPLFDNFYGLGDFQRAKPLQFASDALDNFYFAGVKRGLYPPTIINPAGVVKSSITQDPGAIWLENVQGSIREYKTDAVGLTTYQSAKTIMNGALLNQAGTTDTTQTAANTNDPGFGKTPGAIDKLDQRESTRDNQDRFYLESKLEVLIDRMMSLFGVIGTEDIPVDLFVDDFQDIMAAGWGDDLKDMLDISESGMSAHMSIKPAIFKDLTTRFHLDPGSTEMADKSTQLKNLQTFLSSMTSLQNEMIDMKTQGNMIDWQLVAKLEGDLIDVPELGKIFRKMTPEEMQAYQQQQQAQNGGNAEPAKLIDATNYKDLPQWAQEQWLSKQGFQQPQGATILSTDQQLKTAEVGTKMHTAASTSPEMQASMPQEPESPAEDAGEPGEEPMTPTAMPVGATIHNGQAIHDPAIAATYHNIREIVHGKGK